MEIRRFAGISEANRIVQFTTRSNALTVATNSQITARGENLFATMGASSKVCHLVFPTAGVLVMHT